MCETLVTLDDYPEFREIVEKYGITLEEYHKLSEEERKRLFDNMGVLPEYKS